MYVYIYIRILYTNIYLNRQCACSMRVQSSSNNLQHVHTCVSVHAFLLLNHGHICTYTCQCIHISSIHTHAYTHIHTNTIQILVMHKSSVHTHTNTHIHTSAKLEHLYIHISMYTNILYMYTHEHVYTHTQKYQKIAVRLARIAFEQCIGSKNDVPVASILIIQPFASECIHAYYIHNHVRNCEVLTL